MKVLTLAFACVFGLGSVALAATTKLAQTTVRSKPSMTSAPVATIPAGTEIQVVGQSGGFTQVKFKSGGGWKSGYVASTQLNVGSSDATKAIGSSVAKKTGYGDKDVAAAVMMNSDTQDAQGLMAEAQASGTKNLSAANEMNDEFESLPEDVTGAAQDSAQSMGDSAKSQANAKKNELESAPNAKKIKGEAEAKKNAAIGKMNAVNDQKGAVQDQLDQTVPNAKSAAMGLGDMSGVEMLEGIQYSKAEFGAGSSFVSEGHLKSKTLK